MSWVGAVMMVLLAGVAFDARTAAPSPTIAHSIAPYSRAPTARSAPTLPATRAFAARSHRGTDSASSLPRARPLQSAVLLQAVDCAGNLRMLHLLHRAPVRERLQLAVLWYVGVPGDSVLIRRLLPAWTSEVPLRAAPASVIGELARLGHTSTPTLIVLDQSQRVRFATQSPRSPREFAGLRRIIEGLTWIEEL